jgi:hypothetical protein
MDDVRLVLCSMRFKTWEHAAKAPGSFGVTPTLAKSLMLLDKARTEPIYERLRQVERLVDRNSSPLPPFRARVLLDGSESGFSCLRGESSKIMDVRIGDLIEGWRALVQMAYKAHGRDRLLATVSAVGMLPPDQAEAWTLASLYDATIAFHDDPDLAEKLGVGIDGRKCPPSVRPLWNLLSA